MRAFFLLNFLLTEVCLIITSSGFLVERQNQNFLSVFQESDVLFLHGVRGVLTSEVPGENGGQYDSQDCQSEY